MRSPSSILLMLVLAGPLLAGCSDPGPEPSPNAAAEAVLPTAREAMASGHDLLLALPPGAGTSAFLLDVPADAWESLSLLGQGVPDPYWRLGLSLSASEPLSENESDVPGGDDAGDAGDEGEPVGPRLGAILFRIDTKTATILPADSFKFLHPQPLPDAELIPYDVMPCQPGDLRYLLVVMTEGDATGLEVRLSVPGGARLDETLVRPDLVGGAPTFATYVDSFNEEEAPTGWEVADGRTSLPGPYPADAGSLKLTLRSAPGPGLYALSAELAAAAEGGEVVFEQVEDGEEAMRGIFPVVGGGAQHFLTASGDFGSEVRITLDAAAVRAGGVVDRRVAYVAPLDLDALGLLAPTTTHGTNIYASLAESFVVPTACRTQPG